MMFTRVGLILAVLLLIVGATGCSRGGGSDAPVEGNKWDEMKWDQGKWS